MSSRKNVPSFLCKELVYMAPQLVWGENNNNNNNNIYIYIVKESLHVID
jgi:hypothetical protein